MLLEMVKAVEKYFNEPRPCTGQRRIAYDTLTVRERRVYVVASCNLIRLPSLASKIFASGKIVAGNAFPDAFRGIVNLEATKLTCDNGFA